MLQALLSKGGELKCFMGSKSKAVAEWLSQTAPGAAHSLCAGASGAAPARVPVLMKGLSSSPLHLKRQWLGHPSLPTQQALSIGLLSFPWAPAVSQNAQDLLLVAL